MNAHDHRARSLGRILELGHLIEAVRGPPRVAGVPGSSTGTAPYEVHDHRTEVACHGLDLSAPWATVEASLDELAEAVRRPSP